jgi:Leucine-rich repeat (LRR) protein
LFNGIFFLTIIELINRTKELFYKKEFKQAEAVVQKALQLGPKNDSAIELYALILLNTGRYSQAYETLVSLSDKKKRLKEYWLNLGLIQTNLKKIPEAITAFKKSLTISPGYATVYVKLLPLLEKQEIPEACKYLFQAIRYNGLTDDYQVKLKKYQEFFAKQGGLQAPVEITIRRKRGYLSILFNKISSINDLKNLHITAPILIGLDLSTNKLGKITNLEKLSELLLLNLFNNKISRIEGLDGLKKLKELKINENNIGKIEGLEKLKNLTLLNLSKNQIRKIEGIDHLTHLKRLDLSNNKLASLENFPRFDKLTSLELNDNELTSLVGLQPLPALRTINLKGNQLKSLKGIQQMPALTEVHLEGNNLEDLTGLDKLPELQHLYLNDNRLTNLNGLESNDKIKTLIVDNNNLQIINNIADKRKLEIISFQGNSDLPPPLAKVFDQPVSRIFIKKFDGLSFQEATQLIKNLEEEKKQKQKQKKQEEQLLVELKNFPWETRQKYRKLLETTTDDRCLYCGHKLPGKANYMLECRNRINNLLAEANTHLPKSLRSSLNVDTDLVEVDNVWTMEGPPGQQRWVNKRQPQSRLIIKSIGIDKHMSKLFTKYDYITPRGPICKRCVDHFVARMSKVFRNISGTKSRKRHKKMHEQIRADYYQQFDIFIDQAFAR